MGRTKEDLQTKLTAALIAYADQTGRPDGLARLERVLAEVIDSKIEDDLRLRFDDWSVADLMSLSKSLNEIKAAAAQAKNVGKSKKPGAN